MRKKTFYYRLQKKLNLGFLKDFPTLIVSVGLIISFLIMCSLVLLSFNTSLEKNRNNFPCESIFGEDYHLVIVGATHIYYCENSKGFKKVF